MKEDIKIGATSMLNASTSIEEGVQFIERIKKGAVNGKLTKGQKTAARKMAKELYKLGKVTETTYKAILEEIDKL